jgi:hypothetical protein
MLLASCGTVADAALHTVASIEEQNRKTRLMLMPASFLAAGIGIPAFHAAALYHRLMLIGLACLSFASPSCVSYRGPDGTYYGSVGTNAATVNAGGLSMTAVNQTEGIKVGGEALKEMIRIRALLGLAEAGIKAAENLGGEVIDAATGP